MRGLVLLATLLACPAWAEDSAWLHGQGEACDTSPLSIGQSEVYLVSIGPGHEPFSYIGHAALWMRDPARKIEHILEFGAINSDKQEPFSALLMGDLLCWWRVDRLENQLRAYERADRLAVAQKLDLPPEARSRFFRSIYEAAQTAQQRSSIFHWRDRNCATELRDLLDAASGGALAAQLAAPAPLTPRGEVLRHLGRVRWAWLGWHLLAGSNADRPITRWEATFAPMRFAEAAQEIQLTWPDGSQQPLTKEACVLHRGTDRWPGPRPPQRAPELWILGSLLGGLIAATGQGPRRRVAGLLLAGMGLLAGLLGTINLTLWALSELDAYGPNRNAFTITTPLSFALLPLGVALARGRSPRWGRVLAATLAVLALLALPLYPVPLWHQAHLDVVGLFLPTFLAAAWLTTRSA